MLYPGEGRGPGLWKAELCGLPPWTPAFAGAHIAVVTVRSFLRSRHPGLDPGSRFLTRSLTSTSSGTPGQARGDEERIWQLPVDIGHFGSMQTRPSQSTPPKKRAANCFAAPCFLP